MAAIFISFFLFVFSIPLLLFFFNRKPRNLPPGSFGWPIIGESLDFLDRTQPVKFVLDRMAKYNTQIFKTSILLEPTAVFCGPTGHKFLYTNENKLVHSWWPGSVRKLIPYSVINTVGEEAKATRRLLMEFLNPEALQRYIGRMDSVMRQHVETEWEGKEEVIVFPLVKKYSFAVACALFMSVENMGYVTKLGNEFIVMLQGLIGLPLNVPGTNFYRAIKAGNNIRRELRSIMKQRREALINKTASPMQDLLSHLLVIADDDGRFMTEEQVVDNILGMLFGGHDTTACLLTFLIKYLAEMPDIYNNILREQMEIAASKSPGELLEWDDIQKMKFSWNVAKEVMRLKPPVRGTFRQAIVDFNYADFNIPKGWKLHWTTSSTHMNPDYFPEPEKFDPSRYEGKGPAPYTFVPFGGGPRMCPGKEFARLETLVFLHNMVRKFKWEAVYPDEKVRIAPIPTPSKGLPIRLKPHQL